MLIQTAQVGRIAARGSEKEESAIAISKGRLIFFFKFPLAAYV